MFKSIFGLVEDVATVVTAPVEVAVDLTRCVTKPLADAAEAVTDEVKDATKEITDSK